tara:strand:- start:6357 stop:6539 length:183 start_codon:yes stop_codon:yes gene_type:complete
MTVKLKPKKTQKLLVDLPITIHSDLEDLMMIIKRKRSGRLLKKDFIIEVIRKGISQWHNR